MNLGEIRNSLQSETDRKVSIWVRLVGGRTLETIFNGCVLFGLSPSVRWTEAHG